MDVLKVIKVLNDSGMSGQHLFWTGLVFIAGWLILAAWNRWTWLTNQREERDHELKMAVLRPVYADTPTKRRYDGRMDIHDLSHLERNALSVLDDKKSIHDARLKRHGLTREDMDTLKNKGLVRADVFHQSNGRHIVHYVLTSDGVHAARTIKESRTRLH